MTTDNTAVHSVFNNVFIFLKLLGLYCRSHKSVYQNKFQKRCQCIRLSIIALIWFLLFSYAIFYLITLDFSKGIGRNLCLQLMYALWLIQCVIGVSYLTYWQISGEFDRFAQLIEAYDNGRALKTKRSIIRMIVTRTICCVATVLYIVYGIIISTMNTTFSTTYDNSSTVLPPTLESHLPTHNSSFYIIFTAIFAIYSQPVFVAVFLFYIYCCTCVYLQARHFNKVLQTNIKKLANDLVLLEKLLSQHADLCLALDQLNDMLQFYVFISLFSFTASAVLIDYTFYSVLISAMKENIPLFYIFEIFVAFSTNKCQYLALAIPAINVHDAMNKPKEMLYREKSLWIPYKSELHEPLNSFCNKISNSRIGISVWGFTIISKALLLSLSSLVMTYLVILLQFH